MASLTSQTYDTIGRGRLIDALHLDSSWTNAQGSFRGRSIVFENPSSQNMYLTQFHPVFLNTVLKTSADIAKPFC